MSIINSTNRFGDETFIVFHPISRIRLGFSSFEQAVHYIATHTKR